MTALYYPMSITLQGNPSQHGLCDLQIVCDRNRPDSELRIVVTAGQLAALADAITHKLGGIHLVSLETK